MITAVLAGWVIEFDLVIVCRIYRIIYNLMILIYSEILMALLDILTPDLNRDLRVLVYNNYKI